MAGTMQLRFSVERKLRFCPSMPRNNRVRNLLRRHQRREIRVRAGHNRED